MQFFGPVIDPRISIDGLGRVRYLGTVEDFPCEDPDGDGVGLIEQLEEECESVVDEPMVEEESGGVDLSEQCIDNDGDGWGWIEATQSSCRPELPASERCIDSDGDGWGGIEATQSSCRIR